MWSISDLFPSWGDTGTKPSDGTDRQGGDQISDEEYDYLWYAANELEVETRAALNDLDSNADGIVDKADSGAAGFSFDGAATLGGDVSDGSGNILWNNAGKYVPANSVEQGPNSGLDADSVDGVEPPFASSVSDDGTEVVAVPQDINFGSNIEAGDDGDQTVTVSVDDDATSYKGNDIDSDGDGKVNSAENADNADTLDGLDSSAFFSSVSGYTSRSSTDGTYSNNTGNPIFVIVSMGSSADISIDGVTIYDQGSTTSDQEKADISFIVPDGSQYTLSSGLDGPFSSHAYCELQ